VSHYFGNQAGRHPLLLVHVRNEALFFRRRGFGAGFGAATGMAPGTKSEEERAEGYKWEA